MSIYLTIVLAVLIGEYVLNVVEEALNLRHLSPELPEEFRGCYDADQYRKSQEYLRENTRFGLARSTFFLFVTLGFILAGGFGVLDHAARGFGLGPIWTGLIFAGILAVGAKLLNIPFEAWDTFVVEEKYGFNRTTVKTFMADLVKECLLGGVLGGVLFAAVLWLFGTTGPSGWIYCWAVVMLFQVVIIFIAPVVIFPLFNKFTPLEEGELRTAIENYARVQEFRMKGVFKMDGSRRSTKSNAFFTGFGRFRRIVLFDTLVARHTVVELLAVLAHEMGHYKRRHVLKFLLLSALSLALLFFVLSRFIASPGLFAAFGVEEISAYAGLVFAGFLYSPISAVLQVLTNGISRRYEYEADAYTVVTLGKPEAMVEALKKLTVDNLGNLTPHPLKVFLSYSHPPVRDRIRAIRGMAAGK